MNFLREPLCIIQPNSAMTEEKLLIAEEFIIELVDLGVLIEVDKEYLKTNAPTFCLLKPGQPGQWRVLADMKRGHQNEAIGADPTVFPQSLHILNQLYHGGYTVAIDASKYFYNFPTVPAERCYLGVISPGPAKLTSMPASPWEPAPPHLLPVGWALPLSESWSLRHLTTKEIFSSTPGGTLFLG
jgi:hypothetical protein